jgi:hypothetical protein
VVRQPTQHEHKKACAGFSAENWLPEAQSRDTFPPLPVYLAVHSLPCDGHFQKVGRQGSVNDSGKSSEFQLVATCGTSTSLLGGTTVTFPVRLSDSNLRKAAWLLLGLLWSSAGSALAQQPAGAGSGAKPLPDSPQPKQEASKGGALDTTGKVVGYMTNRSIVFPDISTGAMPLSATDKFKLFINQSISPAYLIAAGSSAGISQARNSPSAYGQGWDAFGERFGAAMGRTSSNAFFCSFLLPTALRQDPRFYPQINPSFWGSVKYSAQRLVVIRNDAGRNVFNASGVFGTMMAEGLANAYLPVSEQTAGKSLERVGIDLAWRFAGNMFKDYWPKVFHDLGLNRLKVVPPPASP